MSETKDGVTIGGAYKESDAHVPASTDLYGVYNTSGTGASQDPATASPIYDTDRQAIAAEILKALDPEDPTPSSRVLFSDAQVVKTSEADAEKAALKASAEASLGNPVVVGGPSKAEAAAAETTTPAKAAKAAK